MTVTLTYDATLARVRITADALAAADYATIERSTDQLVWTTIRGGVTVAVTAGSFTSTVDDYEFVSGVANYYRVRGIETGAISFVATGAATGGDNASLTPAHPGGLVVGDLKLIISAIRNSGTGTVNTPAGWQVVHTFGNAVLLGRRHVSGDSAPLVTFTGGVAGATTTAQMCAFRRAELAPVTAAVPLLNSSAQNIAYPGLAMPDDNLVALILGWKQDDATSVATIAGANEIGEANSTVGDDQLLVWDYIIQTAKADIVAGSFVVTGGTSQISRGAVVALEHAAYLNEQTANLTPTLDRIWIKSVTRPFLNRAFTVSDWSDVERDGRGSANRVVNRSLPVGVTDIGGSANFDLDLYTPTVDDRRTLEYVLASGDILFIHTPAGCEVPGGFVLVDGSRERRPRKRATSRVFTLPLREVAPPGPDVVGSTNTWAAVLGLYATWADLIAANPTWADLLARIADPSEVIVA